MNDAYIAIISVALLLGVLYYNRLKVPIACFISIHIVMLGGSILTDLFSNQPYIKESSLFLFFYASLLLYTLSTFKIHFPPLLGICCSWVALELTGWITFGNPISLAELLSSKSIIFIFISAFSSELIRLLQKNKL